MRTRPCPVRQFTLWAALSLLAGSTYAADPVMQRVQYWRAEVPRSVPVGSPATALTAWLRARNMPWQRDASAGFIHFNLEEVPGDGIACQSWPVVATASLDASDHVVAYDVDSAGACRRRAP